MNEETVGAPQRVDEQGRRELAKKYEPETKQHESCASRFARAVDLEVELFEDRAEGSPAPWWLAIATAAKRPVALLRFSLSLYVVLTSICPYEP